MKEQINFKFLCFLDPEYHAVVTIVDDVIMYHSCVTILYQSYVVAASNFIVRGNFRVGSIVGSNGGGINLFLSVAVCV